MSQLYRNPELIAPSSITNQTTGSFTGTVSDCQTMFDGNELIYNEDNSSPYMDFDFNFTNIRELWGLTFRMFYDGTHTVRVKIIDVAGAKEDIIYIIPPNIAEYTTVRTLFLPPLIQANYIGTGGSKGNVTVSVIHDTGGGGNTNHDCHTDYIALLGRRFA